MKIGFDVSQTCTERAGCAWFADSLARALVDLDTADTFILYHHFGGWINSSTDQGTWIDNLRVSHPLRSLSHAEATARWAEARKSRLMPGAPDIVHANNFSAPKITGAKLVYTVYDVSFWLHPEFTTEENRLLCQEGVLDAIHHADGFVFISENTRKDFLEILPLASSVRSRPMAVIPLGSRKNWEFAPAEAMEGHGRGYWLTVGSLEPRKNYETLLDAQEIYWQTSAAPKPLWIAGGGGWKSAQTRKRIAKLEKIGAVRHLGYLPDAELHNLYRDSFGFLFPSWYEGFGLPVLEAMSAGAPVICSNRASLPEVGGDAVLTIDPGDAQGIANHMRQLEQAPELRIRLIRQGLGQSRRFVWDESARQTLEFYRSVVGHTTSTNADPRQSDDQLLDSAGNLDQKRDRQDD